MNYSIGTLPMPPKAPKKKKPQIRDLNLAGQENIGNLPMPPKAPQKNPLKRALGRENKLSAITTINLETLGPLSLYFPFHDLERLIRKILEKQTTWNKNDKINLNQKIRKIFDELDNTLNNVYKYAKRGENFLANMSIHQITTTNALSICELEHLNGPKQIPNTHDHLQCLFDAIKIIEKATRSTIKTFCQIWINSIIGGSRNEITCIYNKKIKDCEELMVPILALLFKLDHIFRSETLKKKSGKLSEVYKKISEDSQINLEQTPDYTSITPFQADKSPKRRSPYQESFHQSNEESKNRINKIFQDILAKAKLTGKAEKIITQVCPEQHKLKALLFKTSPQFCASQVYAMLNDGNKVIRPLNLNDEFKAAKKEPPKHKGITFMEKETLQLLNEGSPETARRKAITRTPRSNDPK